MLVILLFITLPAKVVAKYCDEYVCLHLCVCVCLSVHQDVSGTTSTIFGQLFYACCLCPWLGPPL